MNLGLDVGYGDVKAVYQREGILEMLKFPTAIAYAEREVGDLSAFAGGEEYEYRGRIYVVGREALFGAFSTRSFEFMKRYSPLFVFKAVKKIHGKTGELVTDVAMGLPLSHYTDVNLKERRKPPHILLQRGWGLMRAEPELVRRQQQLGALPARATMVERTVGADR